MALKTTEFVASYGRDAGKRFLITEMPAMRAANWAGRALSALLASGIDIPDDAVNTGMAGVAGYGMGALTGQGGLKLDLDYDARIQPLMDDLMTCVQKREEKTDRNLIWHGDNPDIEEAATIFMLQKAVLELHLGFSFAAKRPTMGATAANPSEA